MLHCVFYCVSQCVVLIIKTPNFCLSDLEPPFEPTMEPTTANTVEATTSTEAPTTTEPEIPCVYFICQNAVPIYGTNQGQQGCTLRELYT